MRLTAIYLQPKITSISPIMTSEYNSIPMYQYKSVVGSPKAINTSATIKDLSGTNIQTNALFIEPIVNNTTSPPTFTQNVLNTSVNLNETSGEPAVLGWEHCTYR